MNFWIAAAAMAPAAFAQVRFIDATDDAGLGGILSSRLCFAHLNNDDFPDAVIRDKGPDGLDRYRVFLGGPQAGFEELRHSSGLPTPRGGDCLVLADLDNDGAADAILTRSLDINNESYQPPNDPAGTAWLRGNGDGTFGAPALIPAAKPATTACIAVGDINGDGLLDLWLGNWYVKYGESNEAFTSDLLLQHRDAAGGISFERENLPEDTEAFDEVRDAAGRPTYGAMFAEAIASRPALLQLNYGRRANRLWVQSGNDWTDAAPLLGLDGDSVRHGQYPAWLKERAKTDPRFDREDELPFRANGNTFDASIADIDSDGDFDLFIAEITHAWAGESSDRSRFLVRDGGRFTSPDRLGVDRIPDIPPAEQWAALGTTDAPFLPRWNQGDLFCQFADLDLDGRSDLIISSGDYPDPPPFDERLRLYLQQADGTFSDATEISGIDHVGSQQVSLADVDLDGDLDILVGQTFNRFSADDIKSRGLGGSDGLPRLRLFLNQAAQSGGRAVVLHLQGDPERGVPRDALGTVVRLTSDLDARGPMTPATQSVVLTGIGGHAGKQMEFIIHFGLGQADLADSVIVEWPGNAGVLNLGPLNAGHHLVGMEGVIADEPRNNPAAGH